MSNYKLDNILRESFSKITKETIENDCKGISVLGNAISNSVVDMMIAKKAEKTERVRKANEDKEQFITSLLLPIILKNDKKS